MLWCYLYKLEAGFYALLLSLCYGATCTSQTLGVIPIVVVLLVLVGIRCCPLVVVLLVLL